MRVVIVAVHGSRELSGDFAHGVRVLEECLIAAVKLKPGKRALALCDEFRSPAVMSEETSAWVALQALSGAMREYDVFK